MMTRRFSGFPTRTMCLWATALILGWLAFCSPWPLVANLLLGLLALLAAVTVTTFAARRQQTRRAATRQALVGIESTLNGLPGDLRRNIPLALALGDKATLQAIFGERTVQLSDAAIWVRVAEPSQLPHLAHALKYWRDGQGPEVVACLLDPNDTGPQTSLVALLQVWRSVIGQASRVLGYRLPVCVACYLQDANLPSRDDGPWFGVAGIGELPVASLDGRMAALIEGHMQRMRQGGGIECVQARRAARLSALARWACATVLPILTRNRQRGTPDVRLHAFGATAVCGAIRSGTAFGDYLANRSGLAPTGLVPAETPTLRALPEALLQDMPLQPARPALPRAIAHALIWLALFFCAAAAASAWQNRALVQRLAGHIARYESIAPARHEARLDALLPLRNDRDELERHLRSGVPLRLGLGFYQGARWLPRINALIAGYQPPAPATIELDSMSLFRSGSAALNPGSNRVLVNALEMIKANRDRRVLIAGHTDAVGQAQGNLKLSESRAASVRDWLADASGLPISHFAIQGYGDTRPKAGNDTESGRAANRRVEITLVPDCRDQRLTKGQPACSFN